jgi:putative transposase
MASMPAGDVWHFTLRAAAKSGPFGREALVARLLAELQESAERFQVEVYAYCFLPDRLHLIVRAPEGADPKRFVRQFQKSTGGSYRKQTRRSLWQDSIEERRLGRGEDPVNAARNVFSSPVKVGLAKAPGDYPYSGSFVWPRDVWAAG